MARYPHEYTRITPSQVALAQAVYRCWNLVERKVKERRAECKHLILRGVHFYDDQLEIIPLIIYDKHREMEAILWLLPDDLYLSAPQTNHEFVAKIVNKIIGVIEGVGDDG